VIKSLLRCATLAALGAVLVPSICAASPLDIPGVVPPKFRPLVRAGLHSGKHTLRPAAESRFALKTRQGYEVVVIAVRDTVVLEVARTRSDASTSLSKGRALTAYVAHGTVTPGRIEATFGRLGKVSVRFHPSGRVVRSKPPRHCKGARFTRRFGVFTGTVRFTGENHYVAVRAHRAKGLTRSPLYLNCAIRNFHADARRLSRHVGRWPKFTPTILAAFWRQVVSSTDFFSFQIGKKTLYLAVTEESKGSMAEVRYAAVVAPSKTFVSDDALTSATVRPPAPFHGTGSYAAAPDGMKSWTGSLSVSLPGTPRFPLTGPQFEEMLASGF
jgi:ribosomal protein L35AE/L33A